MLSDNDNIILFPLNKIKDKAAAMAADPKQHKKIVDEQTKEFVEGNVDEIAYTLLDKMVQMGIRTQTLTFTTDLALAIDTIRGMIYRDFGKRHPAQDLADKMVTVRTDPTGHKKSARLNYSEVLGIKHKEHKPLSKDIEDEVRDLSDMADIQFTPDFDPEDKK